MVTREAAAALGAGDRLGTLEPGKLADMILLDLGRAACGAAVRSADASGLLGCQVGRAPRLRRRAGRWCATAALTRLDIGGLLAEVAALAPRIAASIGMSGAARLAAALASVARAGPARRRRSR